MLQGLNQIVSCSDDGVSSGGFGHCNHGGEPGDSIGDAFSQCLSYPDTIASIV
jgi:hypothetical protein